MDIVERLRELNFIYYPNDAADISKEAANEIERLREALRLMPKTITDAANEIERLRTTCKELLQHAEYLLSETEKAKEKDVTLLQTRILRARAALKESK